MADLFGFEIKRKNKKIIPSVVKPAPDGSTVVDSAVSAYYGMSYDITGSIKSENDLLKRYRDISSIADCSTAIDEIVNEAIITDHLKKSVEINLDDLELSKSIKDKITEEFENILKLYNFSENGYDLFRQWYIDGKLFFYVVLDKDNFKKGIVDLIQIDPKKIRKIKEIKKEKNEKGIEIIKDVEEYYIFNDDGITENSTKGIKLTLDSVIHITSGLIDYNTNQTLGYLHKAIKPANQLMMMEDALVIYRISRAPERRIFYIDVGNLPKQKAEQYVNDIMNKFRNKIVYDVTTGEVADNKQHLSMMEDFWLPRREGGKGTEITTLPAGQGLGIVDDISYFKTKLYQSLNVPLTRLQPEQNFSLGRSNEITRDEIKFNKFIERLRAKFSHLFKDTLRLQLVMKGIIKDSEWDELSENMRFNYQHDNNFAELKEMEILENRMNILNTMDVYAGKYFSIDWIRKNVLMQSDDDIKEMDKQMETEKESMGDEFDNIDDNVNQ